MLDLAVRHGSLCEGAAVLTDRGVGIMACPPFSLLQQPPSHTCFFDLSLLIQGPKMHLAAWAELGDNVIPWWLILAHAYGRQTCKLFCQDACVC
jgi:hypothetical protein